MAAILEKLRFVVDTLARRKELWEANYKNFPTFAEQLGQDREAFRRRVETHFANNLAFNAGIGLATLVNVIVVGVELDQGSGYALSERMGFFMMDAFFAMVFFGEMLLRQNQKGWDFFLDPWNYFDYCLVVISCVDVVVAVQATSGGATTTSAMRIIRLMRFARHFKGLRPLTGLYYVIQGVIESVRSMFWTGVFLVIVTYTFAVVLLALDESPELSERFPESRLYFGSVFNAMWTVGQVFTLDSWAQDIARPLMMDADNTTGAIILILSIVICNWGILNLIVALMVERMSVMHKDVEASSGKVLSRIEQCVMTSLAKDFRETDTDKNGELSYKEFLSLIREPAVAFKLRMLGFQMDETESFFHLLDADHSGSLTPEEFINGLHRVKGLAKGADICALIVFAQKHCSRARYNVQIVRNLSKLADIIQERLKDVGRRLDDEISDRNARKTRADKLWQTAESRANVIHTLDQDRHVHFPSVRQDY